MSVDKLGVFIKRMRSIGVDIEVVKNYPWVYITHINKKIVSETFMANHGFTVAFMPTRPNQELQFTDNREIFKLIRKYAQINKAKI